MTGPTFDEPFDEPEIIRAKWAMDGARTLSEAASQLRELATALEARERAGWQLIEPIADDYGHLHEVSRPLDG